MSGFSADVDQMRQSVQTWMLRGSDLEAAASPIGFITNSEDAFGALANLYGVGGLADAFTGAMDTALINGVTVSQKIATDLGATADAYDASDQRAKSRAGGNH